MPVLEREGTQVWRRRTTGESMVRWFGWLIGVAVFLYCWQQISEATEKSAHASEGIAKATLDLTRGAEHLMESANKFAV